MSDFGSEGGSGGLNSTKFKNDLSSGHGNQFEKEKEETSSSHKSNFGNDGGGAGNSCNEKNEDKIISKSGRSSVSSSQKPKGNESENETQSEKLSSKSNKSAKSSVSSHKLIEERKSASESESGWRKQESERMSSQANRSERSSENSHIQVEKGKHGTESENERQSEKMSSKSNKSAKSNGEAKIGTESERQKQESEKMSSHANESGRSSRSSTRKQKDESEVERQSEKMSSQANRSGRSSASSRKRIGEAEIGTESENEGQQSEKVSSRSKTAGRSSASSRNAKEDSQFEASEKPKEKSKMSSVVQKRNLSSDFMEETLVGKENEDKISSDFAKESSENPKGRSEMSSVSSTQKAKLSSDFMKDTLVGKENEDKIPSDFAKESSEEPKERSRISSDFVDKSRNESSSSSSSSKHEEEQDHELALVTEPEANLYQPKEYTEQDIVASMSKMLKTRKPPEKDIMKLMSSYINKELPKAAEEQRYDEAKELEQAGRLLNQFMNPKSGYQREMKRRQEAKDKYEQSKANLKATEDEWDQRIKQAEEDRKRHIKELEEIQKREREEFGEDWADPEFLAPFHKPSGQLIQLRDIEKTLARGKEFDRAKEIKKKAELLERQEVESSRERAIVAMKVQFQNMEDRHDKEMTCLLMKERKAIETLQRDKARAMQPYQIQIKKYEEEEAAQQPLKAAVDYADALPTRPLRLPGTIHNEKKYAMLPIGGLEVNKFVKPRKRKTEL